MSDNNQLVYSEAFSVRGHDVNENNYLTIPNLLLSMQRCSLTHANHLKEHAWDMKDTALSWVLLKKEIKIIDHQKLGERYTVLTYPSGYDKFFGYRDYLVFDADKKLVAGASSTWTLIDKETKKLTKIPAAVIDAGVPADTKFLKKPSDIEKISSPSIEIDSRKVRMYDLDWNGHVNNIAILRYCLEPLMRDNRKDEEIQRMNIHFKNELLLDHEVRIKKTNIDSHNHLISVHTDTVDSYIALCELEYHKK